MILALQTDSATTRMWLIESAAATRPDVEWESGRQLADELLGRIVELLSVKKLKISDLTGFIIYSGPGSFTSLRIGHTVANALADSLSVPIVGARGDDWLSKGITALPGAKIPTMALPFYGAEANVTRAKA